MSHPHEVLEQLSAYLDGELDAAARSLVETHLAGCASCRQVEAGLRATLADFEALPQPEPSAQDQWALRAAINRARKPAASRWQRWAAGSTAAAAALALIVSVAVLNGGGRDEGRDDAGVASDAFGGPAIESAGRPAVELLDSSFSEDAARALLASPEMASSALQADGAPADDATRAQEAPAAPALDLGVIDRCEAELFGAEQQARIPIRYIAANYRDAPALFLLYRLPEQGDRVELWVVSRDACENVLLFAQSDG